MILHTHYILLVVYIAIKWRLNTMLNLELVTDRHRTCQKWHVFASTSDDDKDTSELTLKDLLS